ncbi:MAG: LmeA family phospholipid-binding protein [Xenococcaceae cyanobacterium]
MSDEKRLDEQAISKVAETVLSTQIDTAQNIDVDIRTDPLKMVQGEIDSVSIAGKKLVTQQDLQIQEIELETDRVDIDLFSILLGKVELNQPVNSTGKFVVTEADINQNLRSDFILSKLTPFKLNVDGQIVFLELQPPIELQLPNEGKVVFSSNVKISKGDKTPQQVRFTGAIYPRTDNQDVLMEKFFLEEGQAISLNVLVALMNKLKELIDAPSLDFNGTIFRIKKMDVSKGSISLEVEAKINKMP